MKNDRKIKIAAIQMKSVMKDTTHNLEKAIHYIEEASKEGANLACLPELFYSGYHLEGDEFREVAEKNDGKMFQTLSRVAKDRNILINASYPERTDIPGMIHNSTMMIDYNGELLDNVRKTYLWGKEKMLFRAGNQFRVFDTPYGKMGMLICYDAEFPEPMRILALKGAELVLVPSVWSIGAKPRWDIDLAAGALYNLMFTVGINTIDDGACGSSKIVHPTGKVLNEASQDQEEIVYSDIDLDDVGKTRVKIPYINDFKIQTFTLDALKNRDYIW